MKTAQARTIRMHFDDDEHDDDDDAILVQCMRTHTRTHFGRAKYTKQLTTNTADTPKEEVGRLLMSTHLSGMCQTNRGPVIKPAVPQAN